MRDCGVQAVHAIVPPERTESRHQGKRGAKGALSQGSRSKSILFRQGAGLPYGVTGPHRKAALSI
jgi:hypothetical protein